MKVAGVLRASGGFSTGDEVFIGSLDETTDYIKGTTNLDLVGTPNHNLTIRDWDNVVFKNSGVGIGTFQPAGTLQILDGTRTTVYIGNSSLSGCLVLGDSDGVGVTYVTANDGILTTTTTKPGICQ